MQGCTQTLLTKILDTAIASLYSLKRCTISLASQLFYSVPSSTPFFVPCNTRVCFYRAIRATENFNRCADDTGSAPKPACHFSRCLAKILDTAIASLYSLKRCTISLASQLFYSVPSSTPFFVPCNTRVCFYRAIRATENFNRCADDTGSAPKPACHFSRCLAFTLFSVFPFMTRSLV